MKKWMQSLTKLADLEVETLQKRLREIADRRAGIERQIADLEAEGRQESLNAAQDAQAGWYLAGYRQGAKLRRAKFEGELHNCRIEEQGARDALGRAFEEQKKYERLAETARQAATALAAKHEAAVLDELALRRSGLR
jgi:flagellar FliJ protein